MILKKCNLAEFIRVASMAVRGEHVNDPLVIMEKANHIKVTSEDEVLLNLDGESGGPIQQLLITFTVTLKCSCHLMIFVNKTDHKNKKLSFT